jgi:hypothetical protein
MGGHSYWYYVPFQPNAQATLDQLRGREHPSIAAAMDDAQVEQLFGTARTRRRPVCHA